jgi:hypothetical protein
MDRQIVYPGAIPLDTDLLNFERSAMVGLGYLAQLTLGTNTVVDGLACTPADPADMTINIGPGVISQFSVVDVNPFGSLPAMPTTPLVKMGTILTSSSFTLTAPGGNGEATNYLIEASFLEQDATPVVLPYYNAQDPAQPYSGPNNDGLPQNTQRLEQVQLQLKAGAPAQLGSQQTPPVDSGWVPLFVITVQSGQTAINASNITLAPAAPFLSWKLPDLTPGTQNLQYFTPNTQGQWVAPANITRVKARIWGGGGAGGSGYGGAGGGGAAGGYFEGYCPVTPGEAYTVTVGNGGIGSGSQGGASSFGGVAGASGGVAGANGSNGVAGLGGATGGGGTGNGLAIEGGAGGSALLINTNFIGGAGGAAYCGGGATAVTSSSGAASNGNFAAQPGGGGGGGIGTGLGGQGGPGLVILEW